MWVLSVNYTVGALVLSYYEEIPVRVLTVDDIVLLSSLLSGLAGRDSMMGG